MRNSVPGSFPLLYAYLSQQYFPHGLGSLFPAGFGLYCAAWANANVAKLVDALDLGSSGETLGSSSLPIRTIPLQT